MQTDKHQMRDWDNNTDGDVDTDRDVVPYIIYVQPKGPRPKYLKYLSMTWHCYEPNACGRGTAELMDPLPLALFSWWKERGQQGEKEDQDNRRNRDLRA